MEDPCRTRRVVGDSDDLAAQATHQRLIKGFRREEEEYNRNHLLYGDDHIERSQEKSSPAE